MRTVILLIVIIVKSHLQAQDITLEEKAFNHFLDNLYLKEYSETKVQFAGYTVDEIKQVPWFKEIGSMNYKIQEAVSKMGYVSPIFIDLRNASIRVKKNRIGNKPELYIYPKIKVKNKYFIYIGVYKNLHYVGHHLMEYDNSGELIQTYYVGEII